MRRFILCAATAGLIAAAGSTASAQSYTIADGNSSAHFDTGQLAPGSRVGMDQWLIDGVNHMYSQWFWYRTDGMNNEARINSLPQLAGGTSDTNFNGQNETLFLRYGNANAFTIETRFVLQGGAPGSRTADITEQIAITNHSTTVRHFSFFQYCDFDLDNDIQDDFVGVVNPNAVQQYDLVSGTTVSETVFTPTFAFSEVNTYAATLTRLDDANFDNLNGTVGPLMGRADYTWAFQWEFDLAPGQTFLISKDKQITPTPGAIALLGLGGLTVTRRRR